MTPQARIVTFRSQLQRSRGKNAFPREPRALPFTVAWIVREQTDTCALAHNHGHNHTHIPQRLAAPVQQRGWPHMQETTSGRLRNAPRRKPQAEIRTDTVRPESCDGSGQFRVSTEPEQCAPNRTNLLCGRDRNTSSSQTKRRQHCGASPPRTRGQAPHTYTVLYTTNRNVCSHPRKVTISHRRTHPV